MSNVVTNSQVSRIETLEEESRRLAEELDRARGAIVWLKVSVALLLIAALATITAITLPGIIVVFNSPGKVARRLEANELGVYSRDGQRVLLVDDDKFGYPNMIFLDKTKNYRMGLKVWPEGEGTPGMVLYDRSGTRANFRIEADGSSVLNLFGGGGKGGITLAVAPDGIPRLTMTDGAGKVLAEMPEKP
jgi:hypothetical protein